MLTRKTGVVRSTPDLQPVEVVTEGTLDIENYCTLRLFLTLSILTVTGSFKPSGLFPPALQK